MYKLEVTNPNAKRQSQKTMVLHFTNLTDAQNVGDSFMLNNPGFTYVATPVTVMHLGEFDRATRYLSNFFGVLDK